MCGHVNDFAEVTVADAAARNVSGPEIQSEPAAKWRVVSIDAVKRLELASISDRAADRIPRAQTRRQRNRDEAQEKKAAFHCESEGEPN